MEDEDAPFDLGRLFLYLVEEWLDDDTVVFRWLRAAPSLEDALRRQQELTTSGITLRIRCIGMAGADVEEGALWREKVT